MRESDIVKLRVQLDESVAQSRKLEEKVAQNQKYTHYLERVHETVPEDYPEIVDLLNRYKTLQVSLPPLKKIITSEGAAKIFAGAVACAGCE